jgi:hypothetical protein
MSFVFRLECRGKARKNSQGSAGDVREVSNRYPLDVAVKNSEFWSFLCGNYMSDEFKDSYGRKMRNAYRILGGKPEEKKQLGRPRRRWEKY